MLFYSRLFCTNLLYSHIILVAGITEIVSVKNVSHLATG